MLCHPDLFAFDAKYHRSCYSHYISERNIRAARSKNESESNFSVYDLAFKELTVELSNSIFSSRKTVMLLNNLHTRFLELLETGNSSDTSYASWKLKVPVRVQQFFCFWKLFVALNNCANFFGVLTNLNGFIGLRSCRFRAISAISSVHDR